MHKTTISMVVKKKLLLKSSLGVLAVPHVLFFQYTVTKILGCYYLILNFVQIFLFSKVLSSSDIQGISLVRCGPFTRSSCNARLLLTADWSIIIFFVNTMHSICLSLSLFQPTDYLIVFCCWYLLDLKTRKIKCDCFLHIYILSN